MQRILAQSQAKVQSRSYNSTDRSCAGQSKIKIISAVYNARLTLFGCFVFESGLGNQRERELCVGAFPQVRVNNELKQCRASSLR